MCWVKIIDLDLPNLSLPFFHDYLVPCALNTGTLECS